MGAALRCSLTVVLVALASACTSTAHFDKVDVTAENSPPLAVTVTADGIILPEGIAVAVTITPYVDSKKSNIDVAVQSFSPVVDVQRGQGGYDELFITGLTPGSGTIVLGPQAGVQNTDGTVTIPVTVVAQ